MIPVSSIFSISILKLIFPMYVLIVDTDAAVSTAKLKQLQKILASASVKTAPALLSMAPVSIWSALILGVDSEVY